MKKLLLILTKNTTMKRLLLILLCLPLLFSSCSKEDCNCPTNNNNNSSEPSSLIVGLWDIVKYEYSDSLDMVAGTITYTTFPGDSNFWYHPTVGEITLDFRTEGATDGADGIAYFVYFDSNGYIVETDGENYLVSGNALNIDGHNYLISTISNTNMTLVKTDEEKQKTISCER